MPSQFNMLLIFGVVNSHFYVLAGIQTQSDDLTSKIGAMSSSDTIS